MHGFSLHTPSAMYNHRSTAEISRIPAWFQPSCIPHHELFMAEPLSHYPPCVPSHPALPALHGGAALKFVCHEFFMAMNLLCSTPCEFQVPQQSKSRFFHDSELRAAHAMNSPPPTAPISKIFSCFCASYSSCHEKPLFSLRNKQDFRMAGPSKPLPP